MRVLLLTTTVVFAAVPVAAWAQDGSGTVTAPTNQPATGTETVNSGPAENVAGGQAAATVGLGDIVVTAQRRVESSQRAAIPLSVIDGSTIAAAGVTQVDRLNSLVPALNIEPTSTGNLIFLRGVGNFTVVATSDPAVSFNYDGIYIPRPTSTTGVFYDLDRVEVLKGPQGILYGRNATGGTLNVLPAQPKLGILSGYAAGTYGNYNTVNAEGAINLPLGDRAALRVSATTSNHDGYLRDGTQDEKTWAARVQLKAELTPDLTVRAAADYAHNGGVGPGVGYAGRYVARPGVPPSPTAVPGTAYYSFVPSGLPDGEGAYSPASQAYRQTVTLSPTGRRIGPLAPTQQQDNQFYGANADIEWKTGAGTLTLLPAYRRTDLDYLSDAALFPFRNVQKDESYSMEARFAGNRLGLFDYTLGLYYFNEAIHDHTALTQLNSGITLVQELHTKSYAAFGRVVANLSDRLRVVGGLRYTKDDKQFAYASTSAVISCVARTPAGAPNCPTAPFVPLFDETLQLGFPFPAAGGPPIPVVTTPGPPNYLIVRGNATFNRPLSNRRPTYRAAVEYDVTARNLLYASVETGYRSGGFAAAVGFETYQPETITAYTLGSKNRFLNNRVQLNLEAFWWEYKNQQVSHVGLDITGRNANYTQNVGSSLIRGVEVEGRFLVTPTTLVSADVQYLDARQRSYSYLAGPGSPPLTGCAVTYTAANASPYLIDCSGQPSYNSPDWTINTAAQQTIPLGAFKAVIGADTQYKAQRSIGFAYLPEQRVPSYWMSNAQISVGPQSDRWSVTAFVRNIEDSRVAQFLNLHPTAGFLAVGVSPPRTYGIRGAVKF